MRFCGQRLRVIATLSAAAFAVHELRYVVAFGSRADDALAAQGHAYLQIVRAAIGLALVVALGELLYRAGRPGALEARPSRTLGQMWMLISAGLLGVYVAQELVEGALATGHAGGLAGVFGAGGWMSVPLAAALGWLAAFVLREAQATLSAEPERAARLVQAVGQTIVIGAQAVVRLRVSGIARHLAGRAPPAVVV